MTFRPPDGVLNLNADGEDDTAADQSDQQHGRDHSVEAGGQADEEEQSGHGQSRVTDSLQAGGGSSPAGPALDNRVGGAYGHPSRVPDQCRIDEVDRRRRLRVRPRRGREEVSGASASKLSVDSNRSRSRRAC